VTGTIAATKYVTYLVASPHGPLVTVVLTASQHVTGSALPPHQVVTLTFVRDVAAPVVNGLQVTTTAGAPHLHGVSATVYYTHTGSAAESFWINGSSIDVGAGLSHTVFSTAALDTVQDFTTCGLPWQTQSAASAWSIEYCLQGLPATSVITAIAYDFLGHTTPVAFRVEPDGTLPTSVITASVLHVSGRSPFELSWLGSDAGSGLYSVTLMYRHDGGGWQIGSDLLVQGQVSGTFVFAPPDDLLSTPAITYEFASVASDYLKNVEALPVVADAHVVVRRVEVYLPLILRDFPPLKNGDFSAGLASWTAGGGLGVSSSTDPSAPANLVALLGNPAWPCNSVPIDFGSLLQTVTIPQPGVGQTVKLRFRYRIFSNDRNLSMDEMLDKFEVFVDDVRRYQDANQGSFNFCNVPPFDLGWKTGEFTFTSGEIGKQVTIMFKVSNRTDKFYNMYVYLDDVQLMVE
jgi:hypothetical protein